MISLPRGLLLNNVITRKHKQRHEKPFKCNVKDCTRREGFSTSNDLDRHIRSLHPTENATGSRFQCLIGACKNKDKIWPRADNFRAHMKRVHQKELSSDDDLDMYKFSPTASSKEPSDLSQHAIGPEFNSHVFPTDFMAGGSIIPRDSTLELSNEATPMESSSQFQMEDTEDQIAPSSEGPTRELTGIANEVHSDNDYASFDQEIDEARPSSGPSSPTINDTESRIPKGLEEPNPTTHPGDADPISSNTIETPRDFKADELDEPQERPSEQLSEGPLYSSHSEAPGAIQEGTHTLPESENSKEASDVLISREKLSKLLENLQNNIVLGELLGELGWKKDESSESQVPKQETTRNATPEPTHVCSECQKRFGRRCELKKHEKRHLKPYGCTYPGCDKRFGSKNDWKRHENSQHYMLEHWRCDEKQTDSSNICGKTIHRRELFKQHLGAFHNIKDPAILDIKLETCRVGRNCEARFWCGFCEEVIEIRKQGMEAWTERFNHIDDHFHGRNNQTQREIGDWKNEYPLYPRGDSSVDDSEDSGATSSTLASSATLPSIHSHPNKQVTRDARKKRKRDDGYDTPALKRPEMAEDLPRSFCVRSLLP
ncbi:hypothetical protein M426DRAFT_132894 [Hypoxylon sp. CI-4A]|nr:hypothetical protein M426DRAFT_132894 [Hypoxylon sp. CI-4A]